MVGSGTGGFYGERASAAAAGDGGDALSAWFCLPIATAVNAELTEPYWRGGHGHRIRKVAADSTISTVAARERLGTRGTVGRQHRPPCSTNRWTSRSTGWATSSSRTRTTSGPRCSGGTITTVAGGGLRTTPTFAGWPPRRSWHADGARRRTFGHAVHRPRCAHPQGGRGWADLALYAGAAGRRATVTTYPPRPLRIARDIALGADCSLYIAKMGTTGCEGWPERDNHDRRRERDGGYLGRRRSRPPPPPSTPTPSSSTPTGTLFMRYQRSRLRKVDSTASSPRWRETDAPVLRATEDLPSTRCRRELRALPGLPWQPLHAFFRAPPGPLRVPDRGHDRRLRSRARTAIRREADATDGATECPSCWRSGGRARRSEPGREGRHAAAAGGAALLVHRRRRPCPVLLQLPHGDLIRARRGHESVLRLARASFTSRSRTRRRPYSRAFGPKWVELTGLFSPISPPNWALRRRTRVIRPRPSGSRRPNSRWERRRWA